MKLFPAIDIRDGNTVRLTQGDYDRETIYGNSPVDTALRFQDEGAEWIHVVDLDAARSGEQQNLAVIEAIANRIEVPFQVGGGVRDEQAGYRLADCGVSRVVIGTAAIQNPELVEHLAPNMAVAVGLDAWGDEVAISGWEEKTGVSLFDVIDRFENAGVEAFVVTEIGRDGMMVGPDVESLKKVLGRTTVPVIASGGVGVLSHFDDLVSLEATTEKTPGSVMKLHGVIVGRAIYEGRFSVKEALAHIARLKQYG